MANIFDKWNEEFGADVFTDDVEGSTSGGNYEEVPHGDYEVAVTYMEFGASKSSGKPMLTILFKVVDGEHKRGTIPYHQVLTQNFHRGLINGMLRSLTSKMKDAPVIDPRGYDEYKDLVDDIFEAIADNYEYLLSYKAGKKGFNDYAIKEVFPLD